ncbi:hypothetical protein IAR50_004030 [Cryptococcus sp. DSM 104548]
MEIRTKSAPRRNQNADNEELTQCGGALCLDGSNFARITDRRALHRPSGTLFGVLVRIHLRRLVAAPHGLCHSAPQIQTTQSPPDSLYTRFLPLGRRIHARRLIASAHRACSNTCGVIYRLIWEGDGKLRDPRRAQSAREGMEGQEETGAGGHHPPVKPSGVSGGSSQRATEQGTVCISEAEALVICRHTIVNHEKARYIAEYASKSPFCIPVRTFSGDVFSSSPNPSGHATHSSLIHQGGYWVDRGAGGETLQNRSACEITNCAPRTHDWGFFDGAS